MTNIAAEPKQARVASVSEIRSHFPALERRHNGFPVAYFDGPGGTQVPCEVVDAVSHYLYHHNANTHWQYPTSAETDAALADARATFADFFNCAPNEVSFGANMTTLTFHVARALGGIWGPEDEVVVTELDHHANVDTWRRLEKERGVTVNAVRMITKTGQLDWAHFEQLVTKSTKLVAIGAASNALGTINDIRRAVRLAHDAGALAYIDAVHFAPHELVDVRAIDCDFLCCSAYKFYGPHVGVLYGKAQLMQQIDFPKLAPAPNSIPDLPETGTLNHEGIVGAAAAVDFLASLAAGESRRERIVNVMAEFHRRGVALVTQLWNGLASIEGVRLFGPEPHLPRTPTVSFAVDGVPSAEVCKRLVARGLFLSNGDFYAQTVLRRLGYERDGIVRAGCACYASAEEVDRLIDGVREIARG